MRKVIFSKYNTHRAPEFRLKTVIYSENGKKSICKFPMSDEARDHVLSMKKNRKLLADAYKRIELAECEDYEDGVKFEFINGKPISSIIDFDRDSIEEIVSKVRGLLALVLDYKPECIKDGKVFPANIDSNFSNFIKSGNRIVLIDYEWVDEEPVEINFLKYRVLRYTYLENEASLKARISFEDFMKKFGFKDASLYRYGRMELAFQNLVHGKRGSYYYTGAYEKHVTSLDIGGEPNLDINGFFARLSAADAEINRLSQESIHKDQIIASLQNEVEIRSQKLNKVKRCIKNPIYGAYTSAKFIKNKFVKVNHVPTPNNDELERQRALFTPDYDTWIREVEAREYTDKEVFPYTPLISIIVPVYNCERRYLEPCIESVKAQTYANWELILYDDASDLEEVGEVLKEAEKSDDRIKTFYSTKNLGISGVSNLALTEAKGEFVAFLDCDDMLAKNALYECLHVLNEDKDVDMIYSDEDKIDDEGKVRFAPNFKPDYSPDTLLSIMYTCHLSLYRKCLIDDVGGLNSEFDGAQDHDLALRITEITDRVAHIQKVLYHWRERAGSTAGSSDAKPYAALAEIKVKEAAIKRRGIKGYVEDIPDTAASRIVYSTSDMPLVSIIIPTKDHPEVAKRLLSTMAVTSYRNYELIFIDNGSSPENIKAYRDLSLYYDVKYIYGQYDFNFSKMCNKGAQIAEGEYLLFINDDIEVPANSANWLSRMLGAAMQDHAGAVGAKLYYPGGRVIQHCGVTNLDAGPSHILAGCSDVIPNPGFWDRADMNVLAVTAACLMVKKEKFEEVGGFDENLSVAYNDVDLCFKLYERNYLNVIRNDAVLIHHESLSRGDDTQNAEKLDRLNRERDYLFRMHPNRINGADPYRNRHLSGVDTDLSLNAFMGDCVTKTNNKYPDGKPENFAGDVLILDMPEKIVMDGFAFFNRDNDEAEYELLLTNKDIAGKSGASYLIKTKRHWAPHLLTSYAYIPYVAFSGYKCLFEKKTIEPGEYSAYIIHKGKKYSINRTIRISP